MKGIALGSLVAVALAAGTVWAATSFICQNKKSGNLYVRSACLKSETKVKNIEALTGEQGEEGIQGATGPVGPGGGSITGTYSGFPAACATPGSFATEGMNGMVGLVGPNSGGSSYMSNFGPNGKFAIYNVAAGTYKLAIFSIDGTSFANSFPGFGASLKEGVVVTDGQSTDVGTVTERTNCCGNSVKEGDELCDNGDTGGVTCNQVDQSYLSGFLLCHRDCASYSTSNCSTDPQ